MERDSGRRTGRPTLGDVARDVGVAPITVSRALREPERVSSRTLERIRGSIARLGYLPNLVASSLASNRSGIVAAIIPTIQNSIFAAFVQGLSDGLRRAGYQLLLGHTRRSLADEADLIEAFLGRRPDGLVVVGVAHSERSIKLLTNSQLPIVEAFDLSPNPIDTVVGFSSRDAAFAMVRYLAESDYRKIAFLQVSGRLDYRVSSREEGYRTAVSELGLPDDPDLVIETTLGFRQGAEAIATLLERKPDVDAVFCSNDVLAVGAILECLRRGWSVPDRVAVAGFGDIEIASELVPSLTTVHLPGYEIGAKSARRLLDRLDGRPSGERIVDVGFEILHRESA